MIGRFIRNFLNGQHIIHKIRQVQTVRRTFLHQCIKNECPPAAVLSLGARAASSSSNWPSQRSKRLNDYRNKRKRADNFQLNEGTSSQWQLQHNQQMVDFWYDGANAGSCGSCASSESGGGGGGENYGIFNSGTIERYPATGRARLGAHDWARTTGRARLGAHDWARTIGRARWARTTGRARLGAHDWARTTGRARLGAHDWARTIGRRQVFR
uniref:Uncharacterized protein n=1 Tax=Globodera rostochiensis TaxID=31243 RepID=A0A914I368_GLORO